MKNSKRLLAMILSFVMIVSMAQVVLGAEGQSKFSDVSNDEIYSSSVATLNLMGVINGYEDGTFKPEQNVTRAEFTAMLMRTLGYGSEGSKSAEGLPFTDIDDNDSSINWSIPNINTAYSMGIINGYEDNTFRPNANVAYEEAIKMIVCTLGYGANADVSLNPWYTDYILAANQITLTKTASKLGAEQTPASRACIAQLLYDALDIKLIENGKKTDKTILSDYLGYIKNTGIISSNGVTSLTSTDVNLRDDEIQITAVDEGENTATPNIYQITDMSLKDYLGYPVEFYYKDNGSKVRTLMVCVVEKSEPFEINAAMVEPSGTTNVQIKYYKDIDAEKPDVAVLDENPVVIYNGKLGGTFNYMTMIPKVGSLKLVDSNNNNKYDMIEISSYDVYVVSEKASSTYEIIDNATRVAPDNKLQLDPDNDRNLTLVSASGSKLSFNSIAVGNVICYAKSLDGSLKKAIVLNDKVSGTITAKRGDRVTISGKDYYFSKVAPWENGITTLDEPQVQDSGNYYLDINGDIVAYDKKASTVNVSYGYILGYSISNDAFDGDAIFRVLTSSGAETRIGTYDGTRVDNQTCHTGQEVADALVISAANQNTGGSKSIQQVIKYSTKTVNGKSVFDRIYTATPGAPADVENDGLSILSGIDETDDMAYTHSSRTLTGDGKSIKLTNAIVFYVPDAEDRNDFTEFAKTSVTTSFKNGVTDYHVELFDVDKTNVAKVVVLYGSASVQGVNATSPLYVLTADTSLELSDGVSRTQIIGYKSSPDGTTTFRELISEDSRNVNSLKVGDVFRASSDRKGYTLYDTTLSENPTQLLYDVDGTNIFGEYKSESDITRAEYAAILGTVVARTEDNILVAPQDLGVGDTYTSAITFSASEFAGATILVYTEAMDGSIEIKNETNYSAAIAGLTPLETGGTPSKVLIYMVEGDISLVCILPAE